MILIIQLLIFDIRLFEIISLKEKRKIIKSIIERSKQRFNISIIESDYQDILNEAQIAVVFLGADTKQLSSIADNIIEFIENNLDGDIIRIVREQR